MGESDKSKPKKSLDEWVKGEVRVGNTIRVIINVLILPGLVFWLVGEALNNLAIAFQGFFLIFFAIVPLLITQGAISEGRAALIDGKWELKDSENTSSTDNHKNLWRRLVPKVLPLSFIPAVICFLAFGAYSWITNTDTIPFPPGTIMIIVIIIAAIPLVFLSLYWIKRYLAQELSSFAKKLAGPKQAEPEPFLRYFVWEHALPWAIFLGILNLLINLKGFAENWAVDFVITDLDLAYSVWITTLALYLWMGLSAITQVRADVHLGRVKEGRPFPTWLVILLIIVIPIIGAGLVFLGALISGVFQFSVEFCTVIIIITAMIAGVIGRYMGIWMGKTGEFKKIRSDQNG